MEILNNRKYLKIYRQKLRNVPSMAEDLMWGYLRKNRLGVKFRRQHSIGNYILDLYAPEICLNIEIDGEQHEGTISEDFLRDQFLQSNGIIVKRFSSLECLENSEETAIEIGMIVKGLRGE